MQTVCMNAQDISDTLQSKCNNNPTYGLTGLINLGNTCYMNSAIQAFSHNNLLTRYLFSNESDIKKKTFGKCTNNF